jgi:cyanate permease
MRILRRFFDTSVAISLFSSTVEYSIWQCEAFQVNFFWSSHFYIEQGITLHLVAWAISFEALVSVFISFFVRFAVDSIRGILLVTSLILSTIGFLIFGAVKDATGVYIPAWISALVLSAVASLLMLITKRPLPSFKEEGVHSLQKTLRNG